MCRDKISACILSSIRACELYLLQAVSGAIIVYTAVSSNTLCFAVRRASDCQLARQRRPSHSTRK